MPLWGLIWEGNGNVVQPVVGRYKGGLETSTAEATLGMTPMCTEGTGCVPLLQSSNLTIPTDTQSPIHACPRPPPSPGPLLPRLLRPPPIDTEAQGQTGHSHLVLQSGSRFCPVPVQDSVLSFGRKSKHECALSCVCPVLRAHSEQQSASLRATVFLISLIMFEIAGFFLFTDMEDKA